MSQYIFTTDGNYVNFNGGGNLWRLHSGSNCIAWHWDETGDLFFDVYDQQYVVKAENIGNVIIDGTPLTEAADFATAIAAVFTGLAGGSSYLVYTALFNQFNSDEPTVVVLENTTTLSSWSRTNVGRYEIPFSTPVNKNKIHIAPFGQWEAGGSVYLPISDGDLIVGYYTMYSASGDKVSMEVVDSSLNYISLGDLISGGKIYLPEIRVYP